MGGRPRGPRHCSGRPRAWATSPNVACSLREQTASRGARGLRCMHAPKGQLTVAQDKSQRAPASCAATLGHHLCIVQPGSGTTRILPSCATAKCPVQSIGSPITAVRNSAKYPGERNRERQRMMPQVACLPCRKARWPKSLSKVTSTRESASAIASTASSFAPGEISWTQAKSNPAWRAASTASAGTFSFARYFATRHTGVL